MPIEIEYIDNGTGLIFKAIGKVTGTQVIEHNKKVHANDNFKSLKYWIVDRSSCTEYLINAEEVSELAKLAKDAARQNSNLIMALVSETDLQFGMSRMFEAQISQTGFRTKVFRDRKSAEEWISEELVDL